MAEFMSRFSTDAMKADMQVLACAVVLWLAVLGCTLSSIDHQPFGRRRRMVWLVLVTAVPLVGLLCYLPFSFRLESYPTLSLLKRGR